MLCKLEEIDCYRLQSTSEDKGPGVQAPVMRVKCARYWPQCVKETMFFGEFNFSKQVHTKARLTFFRNRGSWFNWLGSLKL